MGRGDASQLELSGARRAVLEGSDGTRFAVVPGALDERAREAFTRGHCHSLALALHEATGWPIVGAEDEELEICHFFVRTPDGRLLDVTDAHAPEEALQLEHAAFCPGPDYLVEQPAEWVAGIAEEDPSWRTPQVGLARSFVAPLLRAFGLSP